MIAQTLFLLFNISFVVFFFFLVLAFLTGAPFVPSTNPTAGAMLRLARIRPGERVVDLGSGDGKLLFLAARAGATAVGYEINPFLVLWSNARAFFSPYRGRVNTVWKNFWRADLAHANVVFVYLLPWRMKELEEKLLGSLQPGTRVVSNSFIFPDWKVLGSDSAVHAYLFQIPKKAATIAS